MVSRFPLVFRNLMKNPWWNLSVAAQMLLVLLALGGQDMAIGQTPRSPASPSNPPAKTSPQPTGSRPLLKVGSQGAYVSELQGMLKLMGHYNGAVNGTYDENTAAATSKFQKAAGLSADGVVGAETWAKLLPPEPSISPPSPQSATAAAKPDGKATAPANSAESFPMPAEAKPTSSSQPAKPASSNAAKPSAPSTKSASGSGSDRPQPPSTTAKQESVTLPILRVGMQGMAVTGLQQRLQSLGYLKGSADGVFGVETLEAVKAAQRKLSLEPDGVVGPATWIGILR